VRVFVRTLFGMLLSYRVVPDLQVPWLGNPPVLRTILAQPIFSINGRAAVPSVPVVNAVGVLVGMSMLQV
jgi:hypothetical protein